VCLAGDAFGAFYFPKQPLTCAFLLFFVGALGLAILGWAGCWFCHKPQRLFCELDWPVTINGIEVAKLGKCKD
jgi:hypothetical protein